MASEGHCCHSHTGQSDSIPALGRKLKIVGTLFLTVLPLSHRGKTDARLGPHDPVGIPRRPVHHAISCVKRRIGLIQPGRQPQYRRCRTGSCFAVV